MKTKNSINIVNRKAKFDYILEREEIAGIQLLGSEVKSIRLGSVNMTDSFCLFENGELWIRNIHISSNGGPFSHDPTRKRKLLLKKVELKKLEKKLVKGYTIIPSRIFLSDKNLIKVAICLAKGKKLFDKRESIKERDIKLEMAREKKLNIS